MNQFLTFRSSIFVENNADDEDIADEDIATDSSSIIVVSASVLSKIDDEKEEQAVVGSVGEHKADDSVGVTRAGPAKKRIDWWNCEEFCRFS